MSIIEKHSSCREHALCNQAESNCCVINKANKMTYEYNCSFGNTYLAMLIIEVSTGRIVNANEGACKFYEYSKDQIINKNLTDICTLPADEIVKNIDDIRKDKEKRYIMQHRIASGQIKDVEVYSNIFNVNGEEFIHCIVFDITKQNKYKRELTESKERYKKLVQLSPHAIVLHTGEKIIFVNKAGAKLFEVPHRKQLIGAPITDFILEEGRDRVFKRIDKLKRTKQNTEVHEMKIKTIRGKIVDVSVSSSVIYCDGEEAILTFMTDITKQKERERLLLKSEEDEKKINEMIEYDRIKTEFFANISHEFRTPINVLLGTLQLLDKYKDEIVLDTYKLDKSIKTMKQNCFRLLRLINNLIDITKIDSGYLKLNIESANIIQIVEDITLSVTNHIEDKGVEIIFDTDVEEKIMDFDPDMLERIVLNLLSNAIKFTKEKDKIEVTVSDKDDGIIISVKDTGIGIPKEKQDTIFDRFRQVDKSLTRNHEGSGIGLSLVKSIVEMHGGTINLKSEYGKGAEFIIELPFNLVSNNSFKEDYKLINKSNEELNNYVEKINIEFSDIYS